MVIRMRPWIPAIAPAGQELPLFASARASSLVTAESRVVPHVDPPFQAASRTSRAAAQAVKPRRASQAQRILSYLRARKACGDTGATIEEISLALGMKESSVCARLGYDLVKCGLVRKTDLERATSSGNAAVVWEAV